MNGILDLDDVQGNIISGYRLPHACYLMVTASSKGAARQCLRYVLDQVTSEGSWRSAHTKTTLNVAVTFPGFARLGLPATLLQGFTEAFRQTTRQRAALLGDVGASAPKYWPAVLGSGEVHLLLTVHADAADSLAQERGRLAKLLGEQLGGLTVVHERAAHLLPNMREHFGYADGASQPDVEGVPRSVGAAATRGLGSGVPLSDGSWRPVKVGEFLLGHADEDGHVETQPTPDLVRHGSYVVYRELHQDVAAFRAGLQAAARITGLGVELLAAKVVGRWRDGIPLSLSPDRDVADDLSHESDPDPPNDFRYLPADPDGFLCPRGAHIRRANPRDALGHGGEFTKRHRIIRRGMPYGPLLPADKPADGKERGLIFVCYQADIARQFEMVQRQWCNDGDAFGLGDDRDYLIGSPGGSTTMTIPGRGLGPCFANIVPEVVQTRGAEYLFAPGLKALHGLATGAWD